MPEDSEPGTYFERIVDKSALADYLEGQLGPAETYNISHHGQGHSNETLFVTWGDAELVIRRPPPGEVASSAHDVLREYFVIDALQGPMSAFRRPSPRARITRFSEATST